jgi:hypothetical protein
MGGLCGVGGSPSSCPPSDFLRRRVHRSRRSRTPSSLRPRPANSRGYASPSQWVSLGGTRPYRETPSHIFVHRGPPKGAQDQLNFYFSLNVNVAALSVHVSTTVVYVIPSVVWINRLRSLVAYTFHTAPSRPEQSQPTLRLGANRPGHERAGNGRFRSYIGCAVSVDLCDAVEN